MSGNAPEESCKPLSVIWAMRGKIAARGTKSLAFFCRSPSAMGVPRAAAKLLLHATILRCSIAIAQGRCHGIGYEDTGGAGLEWRKNHNVLKPWPFGRTWPARGASPRPA